MGGGSAPTPPNPYQVSQQQTTSNIDTAQANAALGNTNQVTPYGSLSYDITGNQNVNGNMIPRYTATQTLSPEQQQLYDYTTQLQRQALGSIAPTALNNVQSTLATKLPDLQALRDSAYGQLMDRQNQQLDRQTAMQTTQLANQGIGAGSKAYENAFIPINQQRVDASNQAELGAGNIAAQDLQQAQAIRNQPLQDYQSLLGFGGTVTQPTYAPPSAGQVAPTDVSGNVYNSYNGQLQQYQQQMNQSNALMGGLFGLGGSLLGAGGFALGRSDRRLKTDIKKIGMLDDGQNVYRYRFIGEPAMQIGLMAQEVEKIKPEAVMEINGVKYVNYEKATDG